MKCHVYNVLKSCFCADERFNFKNGHGNLNSLSISSDGQENGNFRLFIYYFRKQSVGLLTEKQALTLMLEGANILFSSACVLSAVMHFL